MKSPSQNGLLPPVGDEITTSQTLPNPVTPTPVDNVLNIHRQQRRYRTGTLIFGTIVLLLSAYKVGFNPFAMPAASENLVAS